MSIACLTIPGCDAEGFLPMRALRADARRLSFDAFVALRPAPALHVVDIKVGAATGHPDATIQPGAQVRAVLSRKSAFRYLDEVAFIVKRPGSAILDAVLLGRARENDIALAVESVSNLHAQFGLADGRWQVTDLCSRNGTVLNGEALESDQPRRLASGDRLQFGSEVTVVFLLPDALYQKARA
jgi:FHA domain